MVKEFEYSTLPRPGHQIRVLRLLPSWDRSIRCSLEHIEVGERRHTCLSYYPGDQAATHEILINDCKYRVRPNLYEFLQTASSLRGQEALWIDAISINENDIDEKNETVRTRGRIYDHAIETIVWLGLPIDPLNAVYDLRHDVATTYRDPNNPGYAMPENDRDEGDSLVWSGEVHSMSVKLNELTPSQWSAKMNIDDPMNKSEWERQRLDFMDNYSWLLGRICGLYEQVGRIASNEYWWGEGWIVQDIVLSKSAQILTRKGTLKVTDIMLIIAIFPLINAFETEAGRARVYSNYRDLLSDLPQVWQFDGWANPFIGNLEQVRRNYEYQKSHGEIMSLEPYEAMDMTRHARCLDVRDRVFSTYPLLAAELAAKMVVDYGVTRLQLYRQVVVACVRYYQDVYMNELGDPTKTSRRIGEEIYNVLHMLLHALELVAPEIDSVGTQDQVLEMFSEMTPAHSSIGIMWANPQEAGPDTPTQVQERAQNALVGLYTAVHIGPRTILVLEQLWKPGPIENQPRTLSHLESVCYPRAWILQGRDKTCYKGEFNCYYWPELAAQYHIPDQVFDEGSNEAHEEAYHEEPEEEFDMGTDDVYEEADFEEGDQILDDDYYEEENYE